MTPAIRDTVSLLIEAGIDPTGMQFFDLSGASNFMPSSEAKNAEVVSSSLLVEYRPPFPKNVVVWRGVTKTHPSYEVRALVVGDDPVQGIVVAMSVGPSGRMLRQLPAVVYYIDRETGELSYGPATKDGDKSITRTEAESILGFVAKWYECLNQHGCTAHALVNATPDVNRRRVSKGKKPLYEWRTVQVKPAAPKAPSKGGTHASPRLHDRRGHTRRLSTGKTVWIKPHKVGKAELGVVFHDYEIITKEATV